MHVTALEDPYHENQLTVENTAVQNRYFEVLRILMGSKGGDISTKIRPNVRSVR